MSVRFTSFSLSYACREVYAFSSGENLLCLRRGQAAQLRLASLRPHKNKHKPVKRLVILLIVFYQKFISPIKGFRCAYAVLNGGDSCSEAVKKIVREKGPFGGRRDIRARFQACKEANEILIANGQRRRGRNDCDDCPDCDCDCTDACPSRTSASDACGRMSCDLPDLPCDGPCDCSF